MMTGEKEYTEEVTMSRGTRKEPFLALIFYKLGT